jgi:hypothetical protein
MKVLELFSGTESFSKVAREKGHDVFTIDNDPQHNPDLCKDILDLTIKDIPFKPDIIWSSPPCPTFSIMSNFREWDFPHPRTSRACLHLAHVLKTLELIKELMPKYWIIENPRGLLRKFPFMIELNRDTVTYCQYGTDYMKPTDLWNNFNFWKPRPMCKNGDPCHNEARRGSKTGIQGTGGIRRSPSSKAGRINRAIVPRELCLEIIRGCEQNGV